MSFFERLSLRQKMAFLGLFFLLGFAAFAWRTRTVILEVGVGGPVYEKIVRAKDIVADVLPPPEYILEAHLVAYQAAVEKDAALATELVNRSKRLRREYDDRHEYWSRTLASGPLKDVLVGRSYERARDYFEARDSLFLPAVVARDREKAKAVLESTLEPLYQAHRREIDEVVRLANIAAAEAEKESATTIDRATLVLVVLGGLVVFILLLSASVANRAMGSLVARIGNVTKIARRVAAGDLGSVKVDDDAIDTRELMAAIATMTESLRSLVTKVKETSVTLTSTAAQLVSTSHEQDATVQTLSSSTAETAASTKEISATSQALQRTMEGVAEQASKAATVAESGRGGLAQMNTSVNSLEKATTAVSGKLSTIRERATDISGIVTTMTKVADQTNLLSVNAAIEAEKAGEQGRGFLVVAREIRRLADQSAVASLDIEHMVRQMQTAVTSGVMEMDRFADHVRRVAETTTAVSGQLAEVTERMSTLSERIDSTSESMRNQSLGAKHISEAMLSLKEGASQTAASVSELREAAGGLDATVRELRGEIAKFSVD